MSSSDQGWKWYQVGCTRLGVQPLDRAEFDTRWREFEQHAGILYEAEQEGKLAKLDSSARALMQYRFQNETFSRAVLIGMSEDQEEKPDAHAQN